MTTRRPSQLELVRGLAQNREQELAGEVGELMRMRAGAEATLERLAGYLRDYGGEEARSRTLSEIENERRFVQRLNRAIEQQRDQAQRIAERAGQKMELWQRARANLEALDRVAVRREREQQRRDDRVEQREADAATTHRVSLEVSQ